MVSDHVGQIVTSLLQRNLDELYERGVGSNQFGAVKHRGTAMASLYLHAFIDTCIARSVCYIILFVDLKKAFDHAIRELVTGWMSGQRYDDGMTVR